MHYTGEVVFKKFPGFDGYAVSNDGRVVNLVTDREMTLSLTQFGDPTVGMMTNGRQHRRSVRVLVAEAFVDKEHPDYDTPVQLDGDRSNLRASNILWRPRWFAWRYIHQFVEPIPSWQYLGPIYGEVKNMEYRNILEASITNGELCEDIHKSVLEGYRVWPTGELYVYI